MNARSDLLDVYGRWRQWTETEGDAIQRATGPWWSVPAGKRQLKPVIVRCRNRLGRGQSAPTLIPATWTVRSAR
jgi:hypothetical protein